MALTPEEQREFSILEKEFGTTEPEATTSGLTPQEEAELAELEQEFGGVQQGIPAPDPDPQITEQPLPPETDQSTIDPDPQAMAEFDAAIAREEAFLAEQRDQPILNDQLTSEEQSLAEEVEANIGNQLFGETSVHRLQRELGVEADGVIGPNTRKAIVKRYGKGAERVIQAVKQQQRAEFEAATTTLAADIAPLVGDSIKPEWIQAIWMHESGNGNKVLGGTYNLGNLKATGKQKFKEFKVWEHLDGEDVTVPAKFRKFDNFKQAAKGWLSFVKSKRYEAARNAKTFEEFVDGLKDNGYATDPNWVAGVKKAFKNIEA